MNANSTALGTAVEALRSRLEHSTLQTPNAKRQTESAAVAPIVLPPALEYLGLRFGLSSLEQGILLLCAAMELDDAVPELCDRAQGSKNMPHPTFSLAFEVFEDWSWEAMSAEGPLRYWQLLQLQAVGHLPLKWCPLRIDERLLNFLTGSPRLDRGLAALVYPIGTPHEGGALPALSPSQAAVVAEIGQAIEASDPRHPAPIIQLLGDNGPSKQQIAQAVAAQYGRTLFGLLGQLIPAANADFLAFLRLWEREERLLDLALYLDTQEVTSPAAVQRFASQCRGLLFMDGRSVRLPAHRQAVAIAAGKPEPGEQHDAWATVLGAAAADAPVRLASQFSLNFAEIEHLAAATAGQEGEARSRSLWRACLQRSAPRLEHLAQRLVVKADWEQLVLPEKELGQLWQIVHQVRLRSRVYDEWGFRARLNRGLGTAALFAGESGTGKTMAAEAIAKELDLHLYRIDLSAVVSKYIGETEKNLSRLFDAAAEGGAILLFDEADALFGKRSEVKDARDRYANIEVDYLLQRIESYSGLSIMATNLKGSLDDAFLRRLRFVVDFPFPSAEYRQTLWQKVFPPQVPVGDLDCEFLAKLELAGGAIHNIALNAAFLAAEQGEPVEMTQVLAAAAAEWQKLGRKSYRGLFQWQGVEPGAATATSRAVR